ncbi:unnamed protein product, partial [Durusdinium trenchii]
SGLLARGRNHVHFSGREPGDDRVVSGFRALVEPGDDGGCCFGALWEVSQRQGLPCESRSIPPGYVAHAAAVCATDAYRGPCKQRLHLRGGLRTVAEHRARRADDAGNFCDQ